MDKEALYNRLIIFFCFVTVFFIFACFRSLYFLIGVGLMVVAFGVLICLSTKEQKKRLQATKNKTQSQTPVSSEHSYVVKQKPSYSENEFKEWLKKFEPYTKMSAGLVNTEEQTFSKFGGLPTVPEDFVWPTFNNKPIPFLLQIDFSEINGDEDLNNFPTSGVMYVFVDSLIINSAVEYKEGEAYKILFFEEVDNLEQAKEPENLAIIYKEFNVEPKITKTYPDIEDCEQADEIYCNRPQAGMDDEYNELRWESSEGHMLGGWANYIQSGGYCAGEDNDLTLLLQVSYEDDDENFMWGDCGYLYFFISESDLINKNFDNVKLDMQCS